MIGDIQKRTEGAIAALFEKSVRTRIDCILTNIRMFYGILLAFKESRTKICFDPLILIRNNIKIKALR